MLAGVIKIIPAPPILALNIEKYGEASWVSNYSDLINDETPGLLTGRRGSAFYDGNMDILPLVRLEL